jgi:hypothetical protein
MVKLMDFLRLIFAVSLLMIFSSAARAELLVSDAIAVAGVAVGAKFPDVHVFKLSATSVLKILRSLDNLLFVMRGPYEGTLSTFIERCSGLLAVTRRYCRNDTAGERLPIGGTRGPRRDP